MWPPNILDPPVVLNSICGPVQEWLSGLGLGLEVELQASSSAIVKAFALDSYSLNCTFLYTLNLGQL